MSRLRTLWLRAQGVSEQDILTDNWYTDKWFHPHPVCCVACGEPWRPDKPEYVVVFGRTRRAQVLEGHFTEWWSEWLGVAATTGLAPDMDQIRELCTEHLDRWESVPDCLTGLMVEMRAPPTSLQRAWRDVHYWVGSGLRLGHLLLEPQRAPRQLVTRCGPRCVAERMSRKAQK